MHNLLNAEDPEPLGYILLGVFISLWLCGIISLQTLNFYTNYPNERKWMKVFVGILVIADAVQTFMGVGVIWHILIKSFGDSDAGQHSTRTFQIYPALVGLISGSVQIFFAWRIMVLSANLALFAFIVVLAIPQFAGGIAYTILTIKVGRFDQFFPFVGVIIGWVGSSAVCDLVITTALTIILRSHRANQDLGEAAHLMHRIKIMLIKDLSFLDAMTVSLHNGLVVILWSLALLITLATSKRGAYYIFFYPLGKMYLITMLVSLNSRPVVRPELDSRIQTALQRSSPRAPNPTINSSISHRVSMDDVEKIGHPISRAPNLSRAAGSSSAAEYLPVTQEEDDSDIIDIRRNDEGPSDQCICIVVQPLMPELSQTEFPRLPPRATNTISSRPRGPRLPSAPYLSPQSVSV